MKFGDFVDRVYLPWAKTNKWSWKDDEYKLPVLKRFFNNTSLRDITPFSIERFKQTRLNTPTKHKTTRSLATVSLEMALLSRIFSLAMDFKEVETNPCLKVAKLKLDNQRYRYLLPAYQSEADAVDQAHRFADGHNRQFLRVLRQLRDLRRYAPVVIQNAQQVSVGNQQVNVTNRR